MHRHEKHTGLGFCSHIIKNYPLKCEHLSDMWLSTLEIDAAQLRSVIRHRNRSATAVLVWTEAQSEMIFVAAQKLSDIVWTHLSDIWLPTLEIGAAQLRSVTRNAPPQQFLCVNKRPIRYDFRGGAKAIRYSVNIAWI